MQVNDINQEQLGDLFPGLGGNSGNGRPVTFGANDNNDVDLFRSAPIVDDPNKQLKTQEEIENELKAEEEKKAKDDDAEASRLAAGGAPKDPKDSDVDILNGGQNAQTPTYDFKDTSGYFEDRFKNGKFVKVEDQDGNMFIPKTPEEFDEVFDIQINHKLEEERKTLDQSWYESKSPAWQAVAKYAEMTDNPEDILPFINTIKTFNSVSNLNPEDLDHAERIVRERLSQRGDDEDVIAETIDSLKTTDKLISAAQKYKPLMLNQEKQKMAELVEQQRQQEYEYANLVTNIREGAIKSIEAPFLGKSRLKQDEKAAVYDLIAEPSRETKGYQIYNEIDSLFEKGDFDTLKEIALLLTKKDSYRGYISDSAANKVAASLQKTLRVAGAAQAGGGKDSQDTGESVQRNRYIQSSQPRFGR